MKVNTPLLIGASLMLIAAVLPMTNVSAHDCNGQLPTLPSDPTHLDTGCIGVFCPDEGAPHHHKNNFPPVECRNTGNPYEYCPHSSPHSHVYGSGGSASAKSDSVTGGDEAGAGVVTVSETNTADCNGDGIDGDYDGDYETGVGGGFFGYGPWADEPTCQYGLRLHGGSVVVNDLVVQNVAFVIGADDTSGPVVTEDPVDGSTSCSTDGSITPGDPATDPTADADDCLSDVFVNTGTTCGAGGDGGYWVFLNGAFVSETTSGGIGASDPPTTGFITA